MAKFDSFIFDMDGTLWDAVPSYAEIWNRTISEFGLPVAPVTYQELCDQMGRPLEVIYNNLIGNPEVEGKFTARLEELSRELMPKLGGVLYPGVRQTLTALRDGGARLFLVSNCEANGLPDFLAFTGLTPLFTDHRSLGQTGLDKDVNMRNLIDQYGLQSPIYVGDTMGDLNYTHKAGLPFAWASYGFGKDVHGQEYTLNTISDLIKIQDN